MAKWGSMLKFAQYIPFVMDVIKGFNKTQQPAAPAVDTHTREMLDDFKKDVLARLSTLEEEQTRLRTRLKETQSSLDFYRVFVWLFGAFSTIIAIIAVVVTLTSR